MISGSCIDFIINEKFTNSLNKKLDIENNSADSHRPLKLHTTALSMKMNNSKLHVNDD